MPAQQYLDRVGPDVLETRVDLLGDEREGHRFDPLNSLRVLRSECGDCGHAVHSIRQAGLEVSLSGGAVGQRWWRSLPPL